MKRTLILLACLCLTAVTVNAMPFGNGPVVFGTSSEPSLQTIMDNVFSTSIDTVNDQSDVRVWTPTDGAATAYEVTYFAGNNNTLGIYDDSTGSKYLFDLGSGPGVSSVSFEFFGGSLLMGGTTVSSDWSGNFGFFLDSTAGNTTHRFYSEDDMNGGATQAVAYRIADGTAYDLGAYSGQSKSTAYGNDDWLIAFEDIAYSQSDKDFNDAVFYVKDISPVPEPGTLLLLGSGLIGFAYLRRRKLV